MSASRASTADPGLRLVQQLLGAYCATQCPAAVTALRDQIGAHLAADPQHLVDMVLSVAGLGAAMLRGRVARDPARWEVLAPPGQHRANPDAYEAAGQVLNDTLNHRDPRPLLAEWISRGDRPGLVDLVCEATWLTRIVTANCSGRAR